MKEQFIGMNIKKSENKNSTNGYRYILEWIFVAVNRLFLFISIKMLILKDLKLEKNTEQLE